jgi:hypothetical protein
LLCRCVSVFAKTAFNCVWAFSRETPSCLPRRESRAAPNPSLVGSAFGLAGGSKARAADRGRMAPEAAANHDTAVSRIPLLRPHVLNAVSSERVVP